MPSQQFLREALEYDPNTGTMTWRTRPLHHFVSLGAQKRWNTVCAGKPASSSRHAFGHAQICLTNQNWLAHRIIWKWMTGRDPIEVDHRKGADDNRWNNLREAGYGGNAKNRKMTRGHSVGLKGVCRSPKCVSERFLAHISINGKPTSLGSYGTKEEAHAAYCAAAQQHFGEFWNAG